MEKEESLRLFISYSHDDHEAVESFLKHVSTLEQNGLIHTWYDREIKSGQMFQSEIDINLGKADIICLFISANFLSSTACLKEKDIALDLMEKKGISIVPIILSPCGWQDDSDISSLLALPTDGRPVSDYTDSNEAWKNVYDGVKGVTEREILIKRLKIKEGFSNFLQTTDMLSTAHSQKEEVLLNDIFISPELSKFDNLREYEKKVNFETLIENIHEQPRILIAGENQSGKTTICKKLFIEFRKKNLVPIYISDPNHHYQGKMENRIKKAYTEQYTSMQIEEIDKHRIVPIIDDFHFAKNKSKHIQDLSFYRHQVIIVDDIFSLNVKDENLIGSYYHFKIEELTPLLRNRLIKKWTHLTDKESSCSNIENALYKKIDEKTELVDRTLGKIFGRGIMPAYPFFILSIISTYEVFAKPLDQEITSQGYCYQALIYMYLRKQGVTNNG